MVSCNCVFLVLMLWGKKRKWLELIKVTFGFKVIKLLSQDIFSKISSITPKVLTQILAHKQMYVAMFQIIEEKNFSNINSQATHNSLLLFIFILTEVEFCIPTLAYQFIFLMDSKKVVSYYKNA